MILTFTSRARGRLAVGLGASALLLTASCSSKDSTVATATSSASTTAKPGTAGETNGVPSTTSGSPATSAPEASDCPTKTEIVVHTSGGDKKFDAKAAKATVTLGASLQFAFGNYDVADTEIGRIAAPTLTGDQMLVTGYLSVAQGKSTLEPGTYVSVSDALGPMQFNTSAAYTADGKVIFSGFSSVKDQVKLTKVDKAGKKVCGTVTTQNFEGPFTADIVDWS